VVTAVFWATNHFIAAVQTLEPVLTVAESINTGALIREKRLQENRRGYKRRGEVVRDDTRL